jgi:hypothetical protein
VQIKQPTNWQYDFRGKKWFFRRGIQRRRIRALFSNPKSEDTIFKLRYEIDENMIFLLGM